MVYGPQKPISLGIVLPSNIDGALKNFSLEMLKAVQLLDEEAPYARCVAMQESIKATSKLIDSIPQFKIAGFKKPFDKLYESIGALLQGITVDEFASLKPPQSETIHTKLFKAKCAAVVDVLMSKKIKRIDAASRVAKCFPELGLKKETVADWRDSMIGNSNDIAVPSFKFYVNAYKALEMTVDQILSNLKTHTDLLGVALKQQLHRAEKLNPARKKMVS